MQLSKELLSIIGKKFPAIYDVNPPHGHKQFVTERVAELNPQPLPPEPPPESFELGAAMAGEFLNMAWLANSFGVNSKAVLQELDDICPTRPGKIKWPPGWPRPRRPIGPDPEPPYWIDFHVGFALRVAAVADEYSGTALGEVLDVAIDRSLEAAQSLQRG